MSGAELSALSFICAGLLLLILPLRRVRTNVPHIALIVWLLLCNLIHGVNNIIWSSNVNIQVPGWCDMVTKILLGAIVALLAACLCMSRSHERQTSPKNVTNDDLYHSRNTKIIETSLCIFLPVIYMSLHTLVQNFRFDLVANFGCSAAINPSVPALALMWLPPLVLCIISFTYSGLAISNFFRRRSNQAISHSEADSFLSDSHFALGLAISLTTTTLIFVLIIVSAFPPTVEPWISWSQVHLHFYDVNIVLSPREIATIEFTWWTVPILTLIYVALSLALGGEVEHLSGKLRRRFTSSNPKLPMHFPKSKKFTGATPVSVSGNKPAPVVNLNSGWDDMLNSKKSKGWAMLAKPRANTLTSPPASPEPSTSGHTITTREDSGLVKPSIYVTPIAKPNVVNHPPPPVAPPPPTLLQVPIRKDTPKKSKGDGKPGSSIPDDVGSMTSSIWTAPWPEPPADYPNSNHQRSLSSSSSDTFGYPLYPIVASDPSR